MSPLIDLTGQKFGYWLVKSLSVHKGKRGALYWDCECSCGTIKAVGGMNLREGSSNSCGCKIKEISQLGDKNKNYKHGHRLSNSTSAEYTAWGDMKDRCFNENNKYYDCYGGRGITVCKQWLRFEDFIADMGLKPDPKLTLERIDNNGNYEPNNCRWATVKEQAANRRPKRVTTFTGEYRR